MKLSELKTEEGLDVLCELTPYIANISADDELMDELKKTVKLPKSATRGEILMVGAEKVAKIAPILLKKRKSDVLGILAVLNGKSLEEVSNQNFLITIKEMLEAFNDKELIDFFKSSGTQVENE